MTSEKQNKFSINKSCSQNYAKEKNKLQGIFIIRSHERKKISKQNIDEMLPMYETTPNPKPHRLEKQKQKKKCELNPCGVRSVPRFVLWHE